MGLGLNLTSIYCLLCVLSVLSGKRSLTGAQTCPAAFQRKITQRWSGCRKARQKNDAKFIAAARELRDRYLEQVNSGGAAGTLLPAANGKYNVSRQLEAPPAPAQIKPAALLDAA